LGHIVDSVVGQTTADQCPVGGPRIVKKIDRSLRSKSSWVWDICECIHYVWLVLCDKSCVETRVVVLIIVMVILSVRRRYLWMVVGLEFTATQNSWWTLWKSFVVRWTSLSPRLVASPAAATLPLLHGFVTFVCEWCNYLAELVTSTVNTKKFHMFQWCKNFPEKKTGIFSISVFTS